MPISRKSKIWLTILAVPVLLIVAGIIILKVMFTSEKLKAMVLPRAEAAIGRPVTINDISLVVFPSIALKVDGVTIANRKGEGFSSDPFLTLDALRLNVKLLPLLKSRIEVTTLELDRPRILLEVNGRNESNYADLTGGGAAPPPVPGGAVIPEVSRPAPEPGKGTSAKGAVSAPPPASPQSPLPGSTQGGSPGVSSGEASLMVSNLLINGGSVDYVNYKDNSATRIRNLSVALELGTEANSIIITGNAVTDSLSYGTVETPLLDGLRLRLDSRISYDRLNDVVEFQKGDMTVQEIPLALRGKVSNARTNSRLDLTLGADSLNIADLFSLIPREYMKKAEGVKGNGTAKVHIAIAGTLTDTSSAEISGTITASGASIQYPGLPKPITGITLLSDFTRTKSKQEFHIEKMTASLGGAPFNIAMRVVNFDNPSLTLSASGSLNLATVPEFYPLEKGTELAGEMTADIRVDGKVSDPKSLRGTGSLTFRDVSAKTASTAKPVRKVNGTIKINNEVAEATKLSLMIGESDMTLSCRVNNYLSLATADKQAPPAHATMSLQSNHLFTADIMAAPPPAGAKGASPQPSPAASQPAPAATGVPKSAPPAGPSKSQVTGKAAFPLPPMDIDATASIGTLTMEKFEFTNIRGSMHIAKGVVTMQNLSLNAFGGSVVSTGSLDLNKIDRPLFDLSLNLNGVETAALLSHFTSFGGRLSGAMTTSTKLKGALNDTLGLVPDALQGDGKVALKNGVLKGFSVNRSVASALNLPDLETIQFKDWGNDFTVEKGRLTLKDLTITASTGQYVINGSQGLDGSLDYHMALYLPASAAPRLNIPGFAGEAVNLFKDQGGRLKLDFNIGGTTDNPKVQLDTDPAKKKAGEMAKQKLQEQVKSKGADLLKKLFKK